MNNAPTLDLSRQLPLGLDLPKQYHQRLLYLENIFQKEDRIKWVVRVPALRRTLNCFAEAEKIYHYWAKQTATAISWTGGFATSVALFALGFNIWTHFGKDGEEEKRRKRADALDRARPRRNDAEDEERRRMEDEEDKKRREKKEEEEAEREEAGREAEERKTKAAEQLEDMIQGFRRDHLVLLRELSAARADATKVAKYHKAQSEVKNFEIEDIKRENEKLRRRIGFSPGWAPGRSGENPTATDR